MEISKKRYIYILSALLVSALMLLTGCKSVKLTDADDTLARGEYFDASKMYRKIYNRLTKREERPLRGEVAYKLGTCFQKLNRPPTPPRHTRTRSAMNIPIRMCISGSGRCFRPRASIPRL